MHKTAVWYETQALPKGGIAKRRVLWKWLRSTLENICSTWKWHSEECKNLYCIKSVYNELWKRQKSLLHLNCRLGQSCTGSHLIWLKLRNDVWPHCPLASQTLLGSQQTDKMSMLKMTVLHYQQTISENIFQLPTEIHSTPSLLDTTWDKQIIQAGGLG